MQTGHIFLNFNISNDSNFEADSGYIFQRLLLPDILDNAENLRLFFLGHKKNKSWHKKIQMIPFYDKYDKFSTRFHFDWHNLKKEIGKLPPIDLFINNQPEHTLAFQMLFGTLQNTHIPTISYYHYLPFHCEGEKIIWDQSQNISNFSTPCILGRNLESAELSNINLIGSEFGKKILLKAYKEIKGKILKQPVEVISPPIETELFSLPVNKNETKKILYNQRLYKHYGTEIVLDIFNELAKKYTFKLIITDPTGKRSKEREKLDNNVMKFKKSLAKLPYVEVHHCKTRTEYHNLLREVDIAVAPFKPSALWSMAVADVLAAGKPVLCPNVGAFPELLINTPALLCNNPRDLSKKLENFLTDKISFDPEELRANVKQHSAPEAAIKYNKLLNQLQ
jgi:glycosyltransferase involved in cell wall biosynthesis